LLVIDFGLTPDEALPLLLEYNHRCLPPWTVQELNEKMEKATERDDPRGWRVRPSSRSIFVHIEPGDEPVYVGVEAEFGGLSFVELSSLFAGVVKVGAQRELVPELAAVVWKDKKVILTPPSTVATNSQEVWGEFFLANALRKAGADVKSFRLPPLDGRRRTLSRADGAGVLVDPPHTGLDARRAAHRASQQYKRVETDRKALPRKKPSPKLTQAIFFLRKHGVGVLSKDVVRKGKRVGLSRDTLRRALNTIYPPPHTPLMCKI
jgi:hypothetical protein